ncbi:MAG: hypothetical protein ACE365_03105 [Gammaproteobacteria bacterium]
MNKNNIINFSEVIKDTHLGTYMTSAYWLCAVVDLHESMGSSADTIRATIGSTAFLGLGVYWSLLEAIAGLVHAKYQFHVLNRVSEEGVRRQKRMRDKVILGTQVASSGTLSGVSTIHFFVMFSWFHPFLMGVILSHLWSKAAHDVKEAWDEYLASTEAGLLNKKTKTLETLMKEIVNVKLKLGLIEVDDEEKQKEVEGLFGEFDNKQLKLYLLQLNQLEKKLSVQIDILRKDASERNALEKRFVEKFLQAQVRRSDNSANRASGTVLLAIGATFVGIALLLALNVFSLIPILAMAILAAGGKSKLYLWKDNMLDYAKCRALYSAEDVVINKEYHSASERFSMALSYVSQKNSEEKVEENEEQAVDSAVVIKYRIAYEVYRDNLPQSMRSEECVAHEHPQQEREEQFYEELNNLSERERNNVLNMALKTYKEQRVVMRMIVNDDNDADLGQAWEIAKSLSDTDRRGMFQYYASEQVKMYTEETGFFGYKFAKFPGQEGIERSLASVSA